MIVDGQWGEWGPWSKCTASCDGGERIAYRLCNDPLPQHGGANCTPGNSTVERILSNGTKQEEQKNRCNRNPCPGKNYRKFTSFYRRGKGVLRTENIFVVSWSLYYTILFLVCVIIDFGNWSDCDKTCGEGKRKRNITIVEDPPANGTACGKLERVQVESCNKQRCPPFQLECV